MDIQQEIDDLNGYTAIQNVGNVPNTIKRTLNTEIAVRDRDTVMLGGFIKSDKAISKSGVPFLSDIPMLGNLFNQPQRYQRPRGTHRPDAAHRVEDAGTGRETYHHRGTAPAGRFRGRRRRRGLRALVDRCAAQARAEGGKRSGNYDGFFAPNDDLGTNSVSTNSISTDSEPDAALPQTGTNAPVNPESAPVTPVENPGTGEMNPTNAPPLQE